MFKTKFSKIFTFFINVGAAILGSPLALSIYQEENSLMGIVECIPLYLIAIVVILSFFMYRPKECSLFVLPVSYALLIPLYICVLYISGPLLIRSSIGIDTWVIFFATRIVLFYSFPLILITLGLAFYLNLKKHSQETRDGLIPFLLRLGYYPKQKKRKVLFVSVIVMLVLQVIMIATIG